MASVSAEDAPADVDDLRRLRRPQRSLLAKRIRELEHELTGEPDKTVVKVKLELLNKTFERISPLDQQIISVMSTSKSDEEVDAELESVADYEERYCLIKTRADQCLNQQQVTVQGSDEARVSVPVSTDASRTKCYKLPKIELKKFDGGLKNWLGFWSQFSKIHEDASLHETDKFQYLVQSMESGTEAEELVNSYPLTAANYSRAVAALRERYGRDGLLLQVYVRELLKLVISNASDKEKLPLDRMYLKLESHLRALNTLNLAQADPATWLFPLVESSLPEDVLRAWQRSPQSKQSDGDSDTNSLDALMGFVKSEVQNEQQISLARSGFRSQNEDKASQKKRRQTEDKTPTAAGLLASSRAPCAFCDKNHESKECFKARSMSLEQKVSKVKSKGLCLRCLRAGHLAKNCRSMLKCLICTKKHCEVMCPGSQQNGDVVDRNTQDESHSQDSAQDVHSHLNCTSEVILQTLLVDVVHGGKRKTVRALLDSGSQRSYILTKTVEELKIEPKSEIKLRHLLFGGSHEEKEHNEYEICLRSSANIPGNETLLLQVLDQQQICREVPRMNKGSWMQELKQKKIYVADLGDSSSEIELLIGADYYGRIMTGKIHQLSMGLTAIETRLGWTIAGRCELKITRDSSVAMNVISMHIQDMKIAQLWELEAIGIRDPVDVKTQQDRDKDVKEHTFETMNRGEDGRYTVSLPWISDDCTARLSNNRHVAEKRLEATTRKLLNVNLFREYDDIFRQWELEGFIEKTSELCDGPCYYLPHRAVVKLQSSTTPIRPVFDASSKEPRLLSLNDCLEKGPNLIQLLPDIVLRFRLGNVGFVSDIRKAFQMISVAEADRNFLRFLWWENCDNKTLNVYRHKRVVFGVNSSPFLLGSVIEFHLSRVKEQDRVIAQRLLESFYVDNCVGSIDSHEQYEHFKKEATRIMSEAGMELRQWACSTPISAKTGVDYNAGGQGTEEVITPVLGLKWDKVQDTLSCDISPPTEFVSITKRTILSVVSRIFDPIGFLTPVLLLPKMLLQESWIAKLSWEHELPDDSRAKFLNWCGGLDRLNSIQIPRHVKDGLSDRARLQLHVFSDASQDAYAAVVFLRASEAGSVSVQLLQAKARIAPVKRPTIPRLELLGCLIAARMLSQVREALDMHDLPTCFWSDSATALAWIKRTANWNTFVRNRVEEIHQSTEPAQWRHVPGPMNPADLPSRGCSAAQLMDTRWWEGPAWLRKPESSWPNSSCEDLETDEVEVSSEMKKTTTACTRTLIAHEEDPNLWYVKYFSSYMKNIKMTAWMKRFIDKCRKQSLEYESLTAKEIDDAERTVFRLVQMQAFISSKSVNGLSVVRDSEGLLRVNTKLLYRDDTDRFRMPVVLPRKHQMVEQLIRHEHLTNGHAGVQFLMSRLREKVWIIQSRQAVRSVISRCKVCRRHSAKSWSTDPAPLPLSRVQTTVPFQVTGIDLAGPLYLKKGGKAWVVLYTCAVYRCVHLDYVLSLSTEAFLASLQRFICCRGRMSTIYSDNATNFTGADRAFKTLNWTEIQKSCAVQRIQWKFSPPTAAWWGGWWERLIRTMKDLLKRMLGRERVNAEGLRTCLATVESTMNQRPLTTVTEDADDLVPLTPAMFLRGIPGSQFPEYEDIDSRQLQFIHQERSVLLKELQSRFRSEYLSQLVQRSEERTSSTPTAGDVVLIGQDNRKRLDWLLGRVIEVLPGADGKVRVARVKTVNGELIRPVKRLYPLELSSSSDSSPLQEHLKMTSRGRTVRLPSRFRTD